MFKDSKKRLDVIKMCADCRVAAMAEENFDPFGAPQRPNVRTTDDYLREREAEGRKLSDTPMSSSAKADDPVRRIASN